MTIGSPRHGRRFRLVEALRVAAGDAAKAGGPISLVIEDRTDEEPRATVLVADEPHLRLLADELERKWSS